MSKETEKLSKKMYLSLVFWKQIDETKVSVHNITNWKPRSQSDDYILTSWFNSQGSKDGIIIVNDFNSCACVKINPHKMRLFQYSKTNFICRLLYVSRYLPNKYIIICYKDKHPIPFRSDRYGVFFLLVFVKAAVFPNGSDFYKNIDKWQRLC